MQILYILAIIYLAQVDCQLDENVRRYRYETPTIQFSPPSVVIPALPASLNIPISPVLQTAVKIPTQTETSLQAKFIASERPILQDTVPQTREIQTPVPVPVPTPTPTTTSLQAKLTASERPILPLLISPVPLKNPKEFSNQAESLLPPDSNPDAISPYYADPDAISPYSTDPDGNFRVDGNFTIPEAPNTIASDLTDDKIHLCALNKTDCDPSYPWRNIGGHCNNLNLAQTHFGAANQPMPRLLGAKFDRGMVRTFGEDGTLLPNPRSISLTMNLRPRRSTNHNLLIMQIGQFVDHDQVLASAVRGPNGENRDCKSCTSWKTDRACMPIPIPLDDPFFPSHYKGERNCLPFTRNVVTEGKFDTVDPLNFNTAFLDLSTVYGSDHCRCDELRLFRYGLMRMDHVYDVPKGLPPSGFNGFEECRLQHKKCMHTGDVRSNEHMTLLMLHTIFLREHNRLAEKLYHINKHWDDERIFQEARRINIAQYQHVIYQEYLPALIGFSKAREYGLQALSYGYYTDYSEKINPGIVNEFAGAAYRIGHSMVPESFPKFSEEFQFVGELLLRETFHNPKGFGNPREFDDCIRGLLGRRLPALDLHFEKVVTQHLFEFKDKRFSGEDLLARNIARGREFGFPGYLHYVRLCGVSSNIETWTDLHTLIDPWVVRYLQKVYKDPKDIDLFVGGMSEYQSPGALVGPTFSCIIANQFIVAKRGDRFWYENEANGLTLQQLDSIRKTSRWSRILCQNLNDFSTVPYYSTIIPIKSYNPLVRCDHLKDTNLSLWTEHHEKIIDSCTFRGDPYPIGANVPMSACSSCFCKPNGKVKCVPANVNCRSLNNSDLLEESCQLMCGPKISGRSVDDEDVDGSLLEEVVYRT